MPTWEPPCGETCELNFVIECGKSTQTGFEVLRSRRCNALKKSTIYKKNWNNIGISYAKIYHHVL